MKDRDPIDLKIGTYWKRFDVNRPVRDVDLVIAYEDDLAKIMDFQIRNDWYGLVTWLERGRKIKPGDVQPATPLIKQ